MQVLLIRTFTESGQFGANARHRRTLQAPPSSDARRNRGGGKFHHDFSLPINTVTPFPNWLIQKSLWQLGLLPYTHTYTPAARLPHCLSDFLIKAL
jgi:hypothetical protein